MKFKDLKYSIISIIAGCLCLLQEIYYTHRLNLLHEQLPEKNMLVTLFKYSEIEMFLLIFIQVIGYTAGILSIFKERRKIGIIGILLCLITLLLVLRN